MPITPAAPDPDRWLRPARATTLVSLASGLWGTLFLPLIGLLREPDPIRAAAGVLGIVLFAVTQGAAVHAAVTPWLDDRTRRRRRFAFVGAAVLSVPLVAPLAAGVWPSWAWLGATIVGTAPLLGPVRAVLPVTAGTVAVAAAVAASTGGSMTKHLVIAGGIGLGIAAINGCQVWFWDLLVQAKQGQEARARLAAAEERLRFARDVHDVLGHALTVIALKAELAARLAPVDAERAGREADEVRRLAATALDELRDAVHGYRRVDLADQAAAVGQVLRSCGVRSTVLLPDGDLSAGASAQFAAVLREASTNVLRHSRAGWCRIEVSLEEEMARMTVANDGAPAAGPGDRRHGLDGLAERLAAVGGVLAVRRDGDVFTVEATVPAGAVGDREPAAA
ncbi:two-component system, NarL family, sensor histidine kinase DesK [Micromonospora echinospora]|uniref:Two-component system, NarL family, sensor histidine kinase DesK n=1 Tax=Micromonospora echinospora TaxID=1877 RepID=A0A1C4ZN83_MICEC|nr:histidine kinase [Micromonospora echinospora]SCF34392.1 two-component system, NarL family, sensor histidine kinase DesK [Micromonospora echinospora]